MSEVTSDIYIQQLKNRIPLIRKVKFWNEAQNLSVIFDEYSIFITVS